MSKVSTPAPLLRVDAVSVRFGGILALDGVSFSVESGQICGLIGPNGAGKSTVFNCLSRLYECGAGRIEFDGKRISELPLHRVASEGIGRTFQNLALFRSMTVRENLLVGGHSRHAAGFLSTMLRLPSERRFECESQRRADEMLRFLALEEVAGRVIADLPFGTQKRVELGRALCGQPRLLLLDEPACGLNHEELESLAALIREIRDKRGVTVLLVEHHMGLVMAISDHVVVLNFGRKIGEGTPAEIRRHPEVIQAYLGATMGPLLEVDGLDAAYGASRVLHGVDLLMQVGSVTALLGANGAGKTTTLRAICQMAVRTTGSIRIAGERIDGRSTEQIVRVGVAHVPDGRGTFLELTTEENLRLGAYSRRDRAGVSEDFERVYGYFPRLKERRGQQAGTLSGGEQQMLAIGRALMLRPRLLLLDEPSFGLAPLIVRDIFAIMRRINVEEGVSILLVEQNAALALEIADAVYLMETGRIVLHGTPQEVRANDAVRRVYLGA